MDDHLELPGSQVPPPAAEASGHDIATDAMTISIYLKPKDHPAASAQPQQRAELKEARRRAHADDVAEIRAYADANGLKLSLVDPARRLVQVSGTVAAFEAAFGTQLRAYEQGGRRFRAREGALHLPRHLIDRIDAVLGMDTRPAATPKIVPHKGTTPPAGFLPTEVVSPIRAGGPLGFGAVHRDRRARRRLYGGRQCGGLQGDGSPRADDRRGPGRRGKQCAG